MRSMGASDFSSGQTTVKRLVYGNGPKLEKCSGFDPSDGSLVPEPVTKKIVTNVTNAAKTFAEQTPAVFKESSANQFAVFSSDGYLLRSASGDLASVGALSPTSGSIPGKLGRQIIIPTNDGVMAYEPGSPTTKLRPLSLKSPADYSDVDAPILTQSTWPGVKLYASTDDWDLGTGVAHASDASAHTFTIGSTLTASAQVAHTELASALDISTMQWFMLDVSLVNDSQNYDVMGLFSNDVLLQPSGYIIQLCSDTAGTTVLSTLRIPRLDIDGRVYRIAFNVAGITSSIASVNIATEGFWVAPAASAEFTLKIFHEDFVSAWTNKGNYILPATINDSSLADRLSLNSSAMEQIISTEDVIVNGSLSSAGTGWTIGSNEYWADGGRSAGGCVIVSNNRDQIEDGHYAYLEQEAIPLDGGHSYTMTFWVYTNSASGAQVPCQIYARMLYDSGANPYHYIQDNTFYSAAQDGTTALQKSAFWNKKTWKPAWKNEWQQITVTFTVPSGVTAGDLIIWSCPAPGYDYSDTLWLGYNNLFGVCRIDDISLVPSAYATTGTALVISDTTENGSETTNAPDRLRYRYCFAGPPLLGLESNSIMVSNPSVFSSEIVSDPWRTQSVSVTLPVYTIDAEDPSYNKTVADEYGDYITHILVYRQLYDGAMSTWGSWLFNQALALGTESTVLYVDSTSDTEAVIGKLPVPSEVEIANDYGPDAAHVCVSDGRVYLGCLNYLNGSWVSPTAIQVSSWGKPWAYPAIVDEYSVATDGEWLDGYAQTGTEIRGIIAYNGDKLVFLDNEYFLLRGDNASDGWRFARLDSIGCISGRTIANCRSAVIWHDGREFYAFTGGSTTAISKRRIDSTLIDWTKPHNAVFCDDKYVLFCEYNDANALIIMDVQSGAWRIRESAALATIKGITTDGLTAFGVTSAGHVIDLFDGLVDWTGETVREVITQYHLIGDPDADVCVVAALIEAETDVPAGVDIEVTWTTQGNAVSDLGPVTIHLMPNQTRYKRNLNLFGNAIKTKIVYTGLTPPTIYHIGVGLDEASRE